MAGTTYKDAGVDIDAGNKLIDKIKPLAQETKRKQVMSGLGGFAGLFALNSLPYKDPVLVASTDGVGTKLRLAIDHGKTNQLGQDLVAMCVNDLICCGAEPLFFLDYFATGKLDVDQAAQVINSISTALKSINCTLLGGETAEMPGMYQKNDFDVAGFSVGVVERDKIIDGSQVHHGAEVIGLSSSGPHSNGYSLIRKIITDNNLDLKCVPSGLEKPLGDYLLEPTTLYVNPVFSVLKKYQVLAMAHITGGGLLENLPRVIPNTCKIVVDKTNVPIPPLFRFLKEKGNVPDEEMWRVFNMGVGFALIVPSKDTQDIVDQINATGIKAFSLGFVEKRKNDERQVQFTNDKQ